MLNLPETITVDFQPHGRVILGNLREGRYFSDVTGREYHYLTGIAITGTQTSRLFHASLTEDVTGREFTVYGPKQEELDRGHIVRVAM